MGTRNRFPSGRTAKLVLLAIILAFIALDTTGGDFDLNSSRDWFDLVLPWTPLLALLIGPRLAMVTWFAMFTVVIALGATPLQVSGAMLPTMLLVGLCAYILVWRAAVLFTGGVVIMLGAAVITNSAELGLPGAITFATFVVLASGVGFGLSLLTARLERSAKRVAELREQQARVRAEERTRLAYELHDIVANQVTVIAMQARRAEFIDPAKTGQVLENIGNAAAQTLQDLRSLVLLLKNETDEGAESRDAGMGSSTAFATSRDETSLWSGALIEDVHRIVGELDEAGFTVRLELQGDPEIASPSLRQTLGRTLREIGTNILKHGDSGGPVELHLAFTDDAVTLSATNQISAGTPVFSSGTGLEAMRARVDVFGGRLTASADQGRWSTTMSLPVARPLELTPSEPQP